MERSEPLGFESEALQHNQAVVDLLASIADIGAAEVELSADELAAIEDAASKIQVQGGRYAEAQERATNL